MRLDQLAQISSTLFGSLCTMLSPLGIQLLPVIGNQEAEIIGSELLLPPSPYRLARLYTSRATSDGGWAGGQVRHRWRRSRLTSDCAQEIGSSHDSDNPSIAQNRNPLYPMLRHE
jgi:hypothetical protein